MGYTHFSGVDTKLLKINGVAVTTHLGIDGVTASAAEVNKLTGSGAVVASGTAHAHVADNQTTYSSTTETDTAAHLKTALEGIAAKINAILAALEAFGINASS